MISVQIAFTLFCCLFFHKKPFHNYFRAISVIIITIRPEALLALSILVLLSTNPDNFYCHIIYTSKISQN